MTKLQQAMKALRIYDDCMDELSLFVGQMRGRCGDECHNQAIKVCEEAMKAKRILSKLDPDIFPEHGEAHPEFDQQALPQRKGKWKGPYVQPNSFGSIHEEPEMKKRMPLISFDHQVRTPAHQLANEDAREVIFSAIVILLSVAAVVCLLGLAFGWWA